MSVQLPNRLDAAVVAVGVLAAGAVINPLLPNYRARELAHVFSTARPRAVFTPSIHRDFDHEELVATTATATGCTPVHVVCDPTPRSGVALDEVLARDDRAALPPDRDAAAVSELIFTSGTEATPKAIMHTEQTTNFSVRVAATDLGITGDDVVWMPSPLGHSTGFNYGLRFALYHGLPLVLQDRWDAAVAVDLVRRERCSYTLAATTFLRELVEESARRAHRSTRSGASGAAVRRCRRRWSRTARRMGCRCCGSTGRPRCWWRPGTGPVLLAEHACTPTGAPMSGVEVELRDGEIFTRGPNTCVGFFADPERTNSTFDADGGCAPVTSPRSTTTAT